MHVSTSGFSGSLNLWSGFAALNNYAFCYGCFVIPSLLTSLRNSKMFSLWATNQLFTFSSQLSTLLLRKHRIALNSVSLSFYVFLTIPFSREWLYLIKYAPMKISNYSYCGVYSEVYIFYMRDMRCFIFSKSTSSCISTWNYSRMIVAIFFLFALSLKSVYL